MHRKFQKELDHCLKSPTPETSDPVSETFKQSTFPSLDDFVALNFQSDKTDPSLSFIPDVEKYDYDSHGIEFTTSNSSPFVIGLDKKAFEVHLSAATLRLKDDF